jgi:sugar phosphate isomerase/epimerase
MKYGVMENFRMHHSQREYGLQSMSDRPWLFHKAKELGFHGVELGIGLNYRDDPPWTDDGRMRQSIKEEVHRTGTEAASICLHLLNYEENSPASVKAEYRDTAHEIISKTLDACAHIGASVILVPFFGTAMLKSEEQIRHLITEMKRLSTIAENKGVVLALETSLNAPDMVRIVEAIGSDYVQVYYDIGNMAGMDYDVVQEIETLNGRIAQVHVKDSPSGTLGEGRINFSAVIGALKDIGFNDYLVLETPSLDDSIKTASSNLAYLRRFVEE